MRCQSCGTENREGRKFCAECGSPLAAACPACGAANEPGERFCGECGAALGEAAPSAARGSGAERRLVSVLFADLVDFTPLSETRDAEEVRELLSRYFDSCRRIIALYGGTVEKFIGDAVMAVWGTPTAAEPGSVLVGESTRRTTEQTIVYEEAGSFELKGKEGPVPLWKASRVVSGLRGR